MRPPICALAALSIAFGPRDGAAQSPTRRVELIVASTTDVHGRLRGWDYYGDAPDSARGLSRAATIVDSVRRAHPGRVLLVDAGDLLQGNPLTYVAAAIDTTGPHPVIAAMNTMRYDAAAVGNHEFNYGIPRLRRALRGATFPFLAANAVSLGREAARPLFSAYRIVERGGVRVGIVGATTPGAMVWDRENLAGRLRITDIVPAVRKSVADVRRRGVAAVVVVMHSGLGEQASFDTVSTRLPSENVAARVAREVPGIDLIVYGHSHREMADTTINGVLVMQPRNWATSVGVASLVLERGASGWRVSARRGVLVPSAGHAEHPAVLAVTERVHGATRAWVNQALGTTTVAWRGDSARVRDTPLIDFVLEVERKVTGADLAATAAFDLNASIDTGRITVAEVARLYPYDNTLRVIRISGRQLREFLEYSARYYRTLGSAEAQQSLVDPSVPGFNFDIIAGAEYDIDLSRPLGERITRLVARGAPVRDDDQFTLALNNYRQGGGGGFAMLRGAPVVYDRQEEIRTLLIDEVRRRGTLRPEDYHTVNWRLVPERAADLAYRAMRALPFDRTTAPPPRAAGGNEHLGTGRWLRVIGTNDFHGALEASDYNAEGIVRGGAASLMTAIRQARAECRPPTCESIWVDGGDQWQGTPASTLAVGRPVTALFNRYGLDAAALGNHEFDWSVDTMRVRLAENRFPVMAANMLDSTGADVSWMPDDTLLSIGQLKVGVIGIITRETARAARRSFVSPFQFVDPRPIIEARTRALRARGADAVVVVGHVGAVCEREDHGTCRGEMVDLARGLTERVDAMVAGHTHRPTAAIVNGVPITQAWQKGSGIGVIDVPLGTPGARPHVSLRNVRPDSTPGDPAVAAFVDSVTRGLRARLAEPVAELASPVRRGAREMLGGILADAFRRAAGADIGIMNNGGVRIDLAPGRVTVGDVFQVQPFGNEVMRARVPGRVVRAYIEQMFSGRAGGSGFHLGGITVELDSARAPGWRIVRATLQDGTPLDDHREYTISTNDFVAEGGDLGNVGVDIRWAPVGVLDRDALEAHLRALPQPVRPPGERRVIWRGR
jgi:2',3'-cyclic-nucleotide 2'-phosphodiesterase (5'-nucleotidase family)